MGRGRAKAKQTKVARALKYNAPNMDLERLKQDLGAAGTGSTDVEDDEAHLDNDYGDYASYDNGYEDEDEDEPHSSR